MGVPHSSACVDKKPFPSASKAAETYNSEDINVELYKYATVTVDVTDVGAAGTLDVTVERKDPLSGKYSTIATFTQISAVSTVEKSVGAGCEENKNLGKTIRVKAVVGVNAVEFSVGVVLKR